MTFQASALFYWNFYVSNRHFIFSQTIRPIIDEETARLEGLNNVKNGFDALLKIGQGGQGDTEKITKFGACSKRHYCTRKKTLYWL